LEQEKKKDWKKNLIRLILSALLVVVLVQVLKFDLKSFLDKILKLDLRYFSLAVLLSMLTVFTNAYRWWIITKSFNYQIRFFTAVLWYFEGIFANNFFPSNLGGDALRAFYLGTVEPTEDKQVRHHNWLSAGLTVILERILGFTMMFFFFPVSLIFIYSQSLAHTMPEKLIHTLFLLSAIPFLAFFGYELWLKIPIKFHLFQKVKLAVEQFVVDRRSVAIVLFWTFITHVILMIIHVCAALALGIHHLIPFWYWFLVVPLATLASYVIPTIKGVGAREAAYVFLLGIIGVASDNSFAIAVTVFLVTLVASVPGVSILRKSKEIFSAH